MRESGRGRTVDGKTESSVHATVLEMDISGGEEREVEWSGEREEATNLVTLPCFVRALKEERRTGAKRCDERGLVIFYFYFSALKSLFYKESI